MIAQAYTAREAAKKIRVGKNKFYRLIREGQLKARKIGARTIVTEEDLIDYLRNLPEVASQGGDTE